MNNNTTPRIVAAIASLLITTVLLNSVVLGMTATAPGNVSMACVETGRSLGVATAENHEPHACNKHGMRL